MKHHAASLVLLLAVAFPLARTQDVQEQLRRERAEKLDIILRTQDLRTPHDGYLLRYLSDPDPVVRRRATLACGSIQDTSVLGLLTRNLTEAPLAVQEAAAFAIGQTGTVLTETGRSALEYDLLWKRLSQTGAAERLIEEIGKFGTRQGLDDLMAKVGNVYPQRYARGMIRAITRFAIRGITSDDAIQYLLRFINPPEAAVWEVAYALQRIGDHQVVRQNLENIALLRRHADPLVRMHVATLLGKLADQTVALEPLILLARYDTDRRVRVNALRALASYRDIDRPDILLLFKESMFDENHHVALTALREIPAAWLARLDSAGLRDETLRQIRVIAENRQRNFSWHLQAAASATLARALGGEALASIRPTDRMQPYLRAQLLRAMAASGADGVDQEILPYAGMDDPLLACAALDALAELAARRVSDTTLHKAVRLALIGGLAVEDVAVTATAAAHLRDSLFLDRSSTQAILECLDRLRAPDDLEAIQEVCTTLGVLGDTRAMPALQNLLSGPDPSVSAAAAAALKSVTGREQPASYLQPLYVDFDFDYLRSLPDIIEVSLLTVRGEVTLQLSTELAPFSVMSFLKLATRRGLFAGTSFHRVVPNFVVQGGDPRGDGWGGPGYTIRSEFSMLSYETGTLGLASAGKDTEGSQFFITQSPQPHLDGRYTILGRVVAGQDVVDRLEPEDRITGISVLTPLSR